MPGRITHRTLLDVEFDALTFFQVAVAFAAYGGGMDEEIRVPLNVGNGCQLNNCAL